MPSLLCDQRQLAIANGVVSINPDVPFQVLVANIGKITQWLVKNQVLGSVLLHPWVVVQRKRPVATVLGVENSKEGDNTSKNAERNWDPEFKSERSMETRALTPDSRQANLMKELEKLDLDHFPDSHHEKRRDMLCEFTPMWD